jgi:2-polyprenyl-6-methoxyphenol hydroxylase-like FAD-dependent oxidoreductase
LAATRPPYIAIDRIDLHNVLLDACRRNPLITLVGDAMVTRYDESGDGVTVKMAAAFKLPCSLAPTAFVRARVPGWYHP